MFSGWVQYRSQLVPRVGFTDLVDSSRGWIVLPLPFAIDEMRGRVVVNTAHVPSDLNVASLLGSSHLGLKGLSRLGLKGPRRSVHTLDTK